MRKSNTKNFAFFALVLGAFVPQLAVAAGTSTSLPIPIAIPPEAVAPLGEVVVSNPALFDVVTNGVQLDQVSPVTLVVISVIVGIVIAGLVIWLIRVKKRSSSRRKMNASMYPKM